MSNPSTPSQQLEASDEIDLLKLFKSALATWKHLLVALVFVTAFFGAVKAFQIVFQAQELTYSKPIRLTFPNVHKLEFPSGAKFAYSDIVAPAVVKLAYERNNIRDYGISVAELQSALTAAPYSPQYPLIMKRYNLLASDKRLTADQLAELQKQMASDVAQATSGEALITLRLSKKELPKEIANRLLNDIPSIWSDIAIKQKGVLNINVQVASINSINKEMILNEDPLVVGDIIAEKLQTLKTNINKLSVFGGAQSIIDPETGMKILDLSYAVDDMGNYLLGSLVGPIRELGLTDSAQKTIFYYQDRIKKLNLQLAALNKKAASVKTVYESYIQGPSITPGTTGGAANLSEINLDVMDRLVSLSGDAERQKYRQELHGTWIELMTEIANLELTIQDAEQILSSVRKSRETQKSDEYTSYLASTKKDIPILLEKLVGYYQVSERLYKQLSIESVGVKDQLYIPITNTVLSSRILIDVNATILTWLALLVLTTVIVVPGVMIRNAIKARA